MSQDPPERDPLFDKALSAVRAHARASPVMLQRELNVGYYRAVAILNELTAAGHLGPDRPDGTREIKP